MAIEKARLYSEQEAARQRLKEENEALKREILTSHHLGSLIGRSTAISELKHTLERVAQSDSTVLIRGESGTGKGLVARIIHNVSTRREGPFVQFNCAALPETLVESELFGHEKGAFTGAAGQKPGRFELADGGTIFLDEVGKISRAVQAKLLRVVEDKQFERVGGTKTLSVDVRIIAATNLNLEEAIASRRLPRGPLLPAQHHPHRAAAAARAARGRALPGGALPAGDRARPRPAAARDRRRRPRPLRPAHRGRATCASSNRPSTAPWCSPPASA